MKNAVLGFAPEFEIGTTSGQINVFGHMAACSYGEAADFEYTPTFTPRRHRGRPRYPVDHAMRDPPDRRAKGGRVGRIDADLPRRHACERKCQRRSQYV